MWKASDIQWVKVCVITPPIGSLVLALRTLRILVVRGPFGLLRKHLCLLSQKQRNPTATQEQNLPGRGDGRSHHPFSTPTLSLARAKAWQVGTIVGCAWKPHSRPELKRSFRYCLRFLDSWDQMQSKSTKAVFLKGYLHVFTAAEESLTCLMP